MSKKEIKQPIEKSTKETKPFSKLLRNGGTYPVPIKRTRKEFIVLHPGKEMRLETKIADELLSKYPGLKEK